MGDDDPLTPWYKNTLVDFIQELLSAEEAGERRQDWYAPSVSEDDWWGRVQIIGERANELAQRVWSADAGTAKLAITTHVRGSSQALRQLVERTRKET